MIDTPHQSVIERRKFLRYLAIGAACPACLSAAAALASEKGDGPAAKSEGPAKEKHGAPHWGYEEGPDGPENWGELSPAYRVCGLGLQQSPVNLTKSIRADLNDIEVMYGETSVRVLNNGHTIQANCDPGSRISVGGKPFDLLQFHFHHPSEHLVDGRPFDLEAHFVHASADGMLAVLGVFIKPGQHNALLAPVWNAMPNEAGPEVRSSARIRPEDLLPADRSYFRYLGSLTTPPCSEKVIWSLYKTPVEASAAQTGKFASLFPMNARPAQKLHRRLLLGSL